MSVPSILWFGKLPEPVEACWCLDNHWNPDQGERTLVGSLVYRAKTYGDQIGHRPTADNLASMMAEGVDIARSLPGFPLSRVTMVVPVPAFPPKVPYNLPDLLAAVVSEALAAPLCSGAITKVRSMPQAKVSVRGGQHPGAYRAGEDVSGEVVLLVDDVVRTGNTLASIASVLVEAGAKEVGGFAATRARTGMAM